MELALLVWLVGFFAVQLVLAVSAHRARANTAAKPRSVLGWVFLVGLAVLLGLGLLAVVLPPPRSRVSANESATIGDLRAVISAQAAYSSVNGGYFDTLHCLVTPSGCIPGYGPQAPTFLDSTLLNEVKSGYQRAFHPGPRASPRADLAAKVSPSSIERWAYAAVPATPGKTGLRSFCGDESGMIWYTVEEKPLEVRDARCPPNLTPLQ